MWLDKITLMLPSQKIKTIYLPLLLKFSCPWRSRLRNCNHAQNSCLKFKKTFFCSNRFHAQCCRHALVALLKLSCSSRLWDDKGRAQRGTFLRNMVNQTQFSPVKIGIFRQTVTPIFYEMIKAARAARKCFNLQIMFLWIAPEQSSAKCVFPM